MQETPQQYTRRILGYVRGKTPLDVLAATPRQVARLVKGITRRSLAKRPAPEKWSVTEILAHLADVEIVQAFRLRLILGSNGAPIQGYDQNVWAQYSDYKKHDPALSLEAYRVNRERTLRLLKGLPRALWSNYGMHSERGKETITQVTQLMAGHDVNHLQQIRRIVEGR
jgi:hypothetical protein